jgi:hypothetical protein
MRIWLQSVQQLRHANNEFCSALARGSLEAVGDVFERFAACMPLYATFASQHSLVLGKPIIVLGLLSFHSNK